jgi:hypothetical protein
MPSGTFTGVSPALKARLSTGDIDQLSKASGDMLEMHPNYLLDAMMRPRIRERFLEDVQAMCRRSRQERPTWGIIVNLVLCLTIVLIPLAIYGIVRLTRKHLKLKRHLRDALDFAQHAQFVWAYPLMVNQALLRPGEEPAPGLTLISFDEDLTESELAQWVIDICGGGASQWTLEERAFADKLMNDIQFSMHRRQMLLKSLTKNHTIYACDLYIFRDFLPEGYLKNGQPCIPCMAEPGNAGRIIHLPWWIWADKPAPTVAKERSFHGVTLAFARRS